jgi:hypothetical protein
MKLDRIREWAELVGMIAIVASLVFVGLEMNQARELALADSQIARIENQTSTRELLFQYANIWVRGNAGDELDDVENVIHEELVGLFWQRAFWTATSSRQFGWDKAMSVHDFAAFLHRNPGARRAWEAQQEQMVQDRTVLVPQWRGESSLASIVRQDLEKLEQLSAAVNDAPE